MRRLTILGLLGLASLCVPAAGAETPAGLNTWAVIPSTEPEMTTLADLLTVALGQDPARQGDAAASPALRLIERSRILEVAREQALAALLGSEAAPARCRMGRLLQADALVILGKETWGDKRHLRVILCDTRCGARLRTDYYPAEGGAEAATVEAIRRSVQDVRRRFADGVRRVFGVPPFVCRNLTHDFDGLQTAYSCLLSEALMSLPGVAVIETSEAQQIGREIAVAAGSDIDRVVPFVIEGEYEVSRPPATPEPMVTIRLRLVDDHGSAAAPSSRTLRPADVAAYLGAELPLQIARLSTADGVVPLSPERQFAALSGRAEVMARLGQLTLSTGLREAALLVEADDAAQRTALLDEYAKMLGSPEERVLGPRELAARPPTPEQVRRDALAAWHAGLRHLEYLIRNRQTTLVEIVRLTNGVVSRPVVIKAVGDPQAAEAERIKQAFFHDVFPLALALPPGRPKAEREWLNTVRSACLERYDQTVLTKEDLDRYLDLMENVIPDGYLLVIFGDTPQKFKPWYASAPRPGYSVEEYLAFVDRLKRSSRPLNAFLGRYAALAYELGEWQAANPPRYQFPSTHGEVVEDPGPTKEALASLADLMKRADQLVIDFARLKPVEGYGSMGESRVVQLTSDLRNRLKMPRQGQPLVSAPKMPEDIRRPRLPTPRVPPPKPKPEDAPPSGFEWVPPSGSPAAKANGVRAPEVATLTYTHVPLVIRGAAETGLPHGWLRSSESPGSQRGWTGILSCGGRFDVLWNAAAVLLMREKGVAEVVFDGKSDLFTDVRWDGKNVWIAVRDEGLRVVSPEGRTVARVGAADGLPSATTLLLWPLAPGRVCAVGATDRAWCATVDLADGGRPRVNVFHAATTLLTTEYRGGHTAADSTLAFVPTWIHAVPDARGEPDFLLVGRNKCKWGEYYPLVIDPRTWKVSVSDRQMVHAYVRTSDSYAAVGNRFFGYQGAIFAMAARGETLPDGKPITYLCGKTPGPEQIIYWRDRLYLPGNAVWIRINPTTLAFEGIRAPSPWREIRGAGVSSFYGLVALYGGLCQVEISDVPAASVPGS